MSKKLVHDFKTSLKIGEQGEALFLQYYPHYIKQEKCSFDFLDPQTNLKYELKCDSYDMDSVPNFFMERWSVLDKQKAGGVFQAAEHGADFYVYLFVKNMVAFIFSVPDLLKYISDNESSYKKVYIQNKGYTTVGYKIPRVSVAHLFKQINLNDVEVANENKA